MKILAVIPARYASSRFPGKPLADINGEPMVWRVYQQAQKVNWTKLVVATDDERILQAVEARGGLAMMTRADHPSGSDRVGEVLSKLQAQGEDFDFVVNIQGDEPFIQPEQLEELKGALRPGGISSLMKKIEQKTMLEASQVVKVVVNAKQQALYFSRFPIPFFRGEGNPLAAHTYYKHIGLYGYDAQLLPNLLALTPSALEQAESLEQLRWLEAGYPIYMAETQYESHGIDYPEDLKR
ncbi:3-deoxy-manno-octulosonate cytidylyltransferase [Saprospira sp. CCB-QB6]|uniref:3-deoxy-manno-octulosonate cytidylyltransferase n=1 Tax=Saprospira sp. CCB-QB6 TaxID=3023936 RepID=UPI00234AA2F9|nr:3-deoxy-manno-octulosonate cytidylyltransferase [Saprospira sp. CCB-QB6]WCL81591.1 3-deoxy-manno-octulosonate cytidylyltransferase [Saprospira sp. CCB-QB6]